MMDLETLPPANTSSNTRAGDRVARATTRRVASASVPATLISSAGAGVPRSGPAVAAEDVQQPMERFFPGCFEILLPAITSVIPQIVQSFRNENQSRDLATRQSPAAIDRFLPQLLSLIGPVLNQVIPPLISQIQNAREVRSEAATADSDPLERFLPVIFGGVVPPIVAALPSILQQLLGGGTRSSAATPRLIDAETSTRYLGPILQSVLPAIATNLPQLFDLILGRGGSGPQTRDLGVSWQDFTQTHRLWDNDNISVRLEPIDDANAVEIALEVPAHKTWWKSIQLQDDNGSTIHEVWVQDSKKSDSHRVEARILLETGGYLLFSKAKAFGIHTGMYRLSTAGLNDLRGQRAIFYWYAD